MICLSCGKTLTDEEAHYYEIGCEECEQEKTDRIYAWRHGAEDAELDELYDGPSPLCQ